ncbi:MAG: RNA polymerase sigma factor [bacterium]|nr:RNA polymerase sigma factor [bacterium]
MNDQITSQAFFKKLRKRNKEAFKILYENFKIPLYSVVISIIKDKDKTADIIQDTFIKVIKNIHQLEDITKIKYWIFKIGVNLTINAMKKDKRFSYAVGEELENIAAQRENFHSSARGVENVEELYHAVQRQVALLPLKQRVAFTLKYVDNFKETEIGEILDIPVGTVKSRLSVARNKIKDAIKSEA